MKDKKWIDCPVCGETNSMVFKTDLISVYEMAKKLKLSRQSIHKMMNMGKIRYVFVGGIRLPLKNQNVSPK